jgi:hypothetical protein
MTMESRSPRLRSLLDFASSIAIVATCGVLVWFLTSALPKRPSAERISLPIQPISVDGSAHLGSPLADVVLLVYSDFICPFCGRFSRETLPEIRRTCIEPGRLRLVSQGRSDGE